MVATADLHRRDYFKPDFFNGIAQSHPFEQGNKRTAFVAMVQSLNANGYELLIEDSSPWADVVIDLVEHRSTEEDFVRTIRPFVV